MAVLLSQSGEVFAIGASRFSDLGEGPTEREAKLYVKVIPGNLGMPILAQLDTGSPWSAFDPEVAASLGLSDMPGETYRLQTRIGMMIGTLQRVQITLPADQGLGQDVEISATVFVCEDWPAGRHFLGYGGLLERLRFAVDPASNSFLFGPID